jgi:ferrous iron transport protein A
MTRQHLAGGGAGSPGIAHGAPAQAATPADRAPPVPLDAWPLDQAARVAALQAPAGCGDWLRALDDLGFVPGELVQVMRRAPPGGDPLVVRVGSSTYALRRAEAACIHVRPLE